MKKKISVLTLYVIVFMVIAQNKPSELLYKALPFSDYKILRDSCTQLDVVFLSSASGSLSVDGRSVSLFSNFVDSKAIAKKSNSSKDGFIMWQKNGREFVTGDIYFLSDSSGYLHFKKDGKDFYNLLTTQGATFLKSQKK
jgi:hypothetical protein